MSVLRRRPVVYRIQVLHWAVAVIVAITSTVLSVAAGDRQVVALVVQGVGVLGAAAVWRFSEYRIHRLGPPATTGFNGSTFAGIFAMVII